jgi:serine/threonine-protein kinase
MIEYEDTIPTARRVCLVCQKEYPPEERRCPLDGTVLVALSADLYVGKTIGDRYEVQDLLGQGGTSIVYRAYQTQLRRMVAIKMLKAHLVIDEESKRRFEQEARAVSCLTHPNVISVFDVGVSRHSEPYIVMEYLNGTPLSDLIAKQGKLEAPEAVHIFSQCCAALAHAHQKEVIHRDVKPSNIMLLDSEEDPYVVKILDFGLAKLHSLTGEFQRLTKTGEVFGSPVYMSPEQCTGKKLDARTDIYSMGVVMYETLIGRPPFKDRDSIQIIRRQIKETPRALHAIAPDVKIPAALEAIVFRCLAKSPEERFASMEELKCALDALQMEPARRKLVVAADKSLTGPEALPPSAAPAKGPGANRKALIQAGALLLLFLALMALFVWMLR